MQFYMPTRLITGNGAVVKNADLIAGFGKKTLIVTSGSGARKSGALDDVLKVLDDKKIEYKIYDKIQQNPTMTSCKEAGALAKEMQAEFIIGIGGGSPLDAAKIVAKEAEDPALPIILVGTTAGTGSEVTPVSVITNDEGRKKSYKGDDMYAKLAFGDPKYTMSLPEKFTISTAIDALAHCVESYFSTAANDISRAVAIRGTCMILAELEKIANNEELTIEDREKLYDASILGGLAIAVSGTVVPHMLGYYLTEEKGFPHGMACAMFLPELMEHVMRLDPEYTEGFYKKIHYAPEKFIGIIKGFLDEDPVMTEDEIEAVLPRYATDPKLAKTVGGYTVEEIRGIFRNRFLK